MAFLRGSVADKVVEAEGKSLNKGDILLVDGFPEEFNGLKKYSLTGEFQGKHHTFHISGRS